MSRSNSGLRLSGGGGRRNMCNFAAIGWQHNTCPQTIDLSALLVTHLSHYIVPADFEKCSELLLYAVPLEGEAWP